MLLAVFMSLSARVSADEFDDRIRTIYMYGDYGLGTYKSTLMESNHTNGIVTYGVGTYSGYDRVLGIDHRVESATTTFALNSSSLQMIWKTTAIKYRVWAFELGPVIGSVTAKANREGTDIMEAVGEGYGGYFSISMPVGKNNTFDMRATQVSTGEMIDKQQRVVAVGPRLDLELSSRIVIAKRGFDAMIGYRRRTYSITEGGSGYLELQTATCVGFVTGFNF